MTLEFVDFAERFTPLKKGAGGCQSAACNFAVELCCRTQAKGYAKQIGFVKRCFLSRTDKNVLPT